MVIAERANTFNIFTVTFPITWQMILGKYRMGIVLSARPSFRKILVKKKSKKKKALSTNRNDIGNALSCILSMLRTAKSCRLIRLKLAVILPGLGTKGESENCRQCSKNS